VIFTLRACNSNIRFIPTADGLNPSHPGASNGVGRASLLRGGGLARPDILLPIREWKLAISEKLSKSSSIYSGKKGAKLSFYYLITMAVRLIFISV
jgi:hypothetical protein